MFRHAASLTNGSRNCWWHRNGRWTFPSTSCHRNIRCLTWSSQPRTRTSGIDGEGNENELIVKLFKTISFSIGYETKCKEMMEKIWSLLYYNYSFAKKMFNSSMYTSLSIRSSVDSSVWIGCCNSASVKTDINMEPNSLDREGIWETILMVSGRKSQKDYLWNLSIYYLDWDSLYNLYNHHHHNLHVFYSRKMYSD